MSSAVKVVLVSKSGYDSSHDALLEALIARGIALFCAVGKDCEMWEDVMDALVVGPDGSGASFIVSTSHPGESVEEVVEFAEGWILEGGDGVEVIEV